MDRSRTRRQRDRHGGGPGVARGARMARPHGNGQCLRPGQCPEPLAVERPGAAQERPQLALHRRGRAGAPGRSRVLGCAVRALHGQPPPHAISGSRPARCDRGHRDCCRRGLGDDAPSVHAGLREALVPAGPGLGLCRLRAGHRPGQPRGAPARAKVTMSGSMGRGSMGRDYYHNCDFTHSLAKDEIHKLSNFVIGATLDPFTSRGMAANSRLADSTMLVVGFRIHLEGGRE